MTVIPVTFAEACEYVRQYHRHHSPPIGHKFSLAAETNNTICGVVIVSRPVARMLDDFWTLEVTRCCTDGTPNACSFLYAAAWRAARALGFKRLITYTLSTESGTSLNAAGWKCLGECGGGSWHRTRRPRIDTHPLQRKLRWEA